MKRRVQAQRKFAAGAYIPVSNRPPTVERRIDTPISDPKVVQIHSSPSSILDVVAFQGIHTHRQPVVVLKRLNTNAKKPQVPTTKKRKSNQSQDSSPSNQHSSPNTPVCTRKRTSNNAQGKTSPDTSPLSNLSSPTTSDISLKSERLSRKKSIIDDQPDLNKKAEDEAPAQCISGLIKSVKEILLFKDTVLKNRCLKCSCCDKINSVLTQLSQLDRNLFPNGNGTDNKILTFIDLKKEIQENGDILNDEGRRLIKLNSKKENGDLTETKTEKDPYALEDDLPTTKNGDLEKPAPFKSKDIKRKKRVNTEAQECSIVLPKLTESKTEAKTVSIASKSKVKENAKKKPLQGKAKEVVEKKDVDKKETREENAPSTSNSNRRLRSVSTSSDEEVLAKKKSSGKVLLDAPVFRPSEQEFKDPLVYIESILPAASKYGLCKVIPPKGFKPSCKLDCNMRFGITNQYINRMYRRWGPASKKLAAVKAHLACQKVPFKRPPLLAGVEVNLPKLFNIVQRMGGLKSGFTDQKWQKVAEQIGCCKYIKKPGAKLESIYARYLLPYDALTTIEKRKLMDKVDIEWNKRNRMMLSRALSPLHRQKQMLEDANSSEDEEFNTKEDRTIFEALAEIEDCVVAGRSMNLSAFEKVAESASKALLETADMSTEAIEKAYWELVVFGTQHVCVNAASIDTGATDNGFPCNEDDPYANHPWNLKRISENTRNMLSFLGPVVGMTVPTLHLAMVYSTSCWHRDPHGLPWIEYMHQGADRVWYGINNEQSENFRQAVEELCPSFCQNKSVWLPSDITMIPPDLLRQQNVSLCRATQKPGEFIIVCPMAYSCSIATGFTISESVYFATPAWIKNLGQLFQELRNSCEPTMFSLEQLLLSFVKDTRTPLKVLQEIQPYLNEIVENELSNRRNLKKVGLKNFTTGRDQANTSGAWNVRDQDECDICRKPLYLSRGKGVFHKNSVLCSDHTLEVLKKPWSENLLKEPKRITLEVIYTYAQLNDLLQALKKRLKS